VTALIPAIVQCDPEVCRQLAEAVGGWVEPTIAVVAVIGALSIIVLEARR